MRSSHVSIAALLILLLFSRTGLADEKHCLWKIESEGSFVYLLGSIHMMTEEQYPLAPAIEDAFEDADGLVFEASIDSLQDPNHQAKLMSEGLYPEGQTLKSKISPKIYEAVQKRIASYGMPMDLFETFRPWLLALTITALEAQKLGFQPQHGLDVHFNTRAKDAGKEIGQLESLRFQVGLFAGITEERQEAFLEYSLAELDLMAEVLDSILESWESGNVTALDSLFVHRLVSAEEWSDLVDRLVFSRNKDWVPKIEHLLATGKDHLVVVGVLHLVGEGSVIDLLRERGHIVEQM